MRRVGNYLRDHAMALRDADELNVFARSAINRYYYATFMLSRNMYRQVFPGQRVPSHDGMPKALVGKLRTKIKEHAKDAEKLGLLRVDEHTNVVRRVTIILSSLHDLLASSYQTRTIADYYPEITAVRTNGSISLDRVKIGTAASWPEKADRLCGQLLAEWKRLGN